MSSKPGQARWECAQLLRPCCREPPSVTSLGSLPGAAPAMLQGRKLAFLASSLIPAVVCCFPAFGTFWRNLARKAKGPAGPGAAFAELPRLARPLSLMSADKISYRYWRGENSWEHKGAAGEWGRTGVGLAGAGWGPLLLDPSR